MTEDIYNVIEFDLNGQIEGWITQSKLWRRLGDDIAARREYSPLTIKALYIYGLILSSCRSVSLLLSGDLLTSTTYYPAYIVFASSVELLGRCISGNSSTRGSSKNLISGFKWLLKPEYPVYVDLPIHRVVVTTKNFPYTINDLVSIRNYTAHGQATSSNELKQFDYLILAEFPLIFGNAVERYFKLLMSSRKVAENLAKASVIPYRNRPVSDSLWATNASMSEFVSSLGDLIRKMDWSYKIPPGFR